MELWAKASPPLWPLLTCQSSLSDDLEDQLLHGFSVAQLLTRASNTVLVSQSQQLLLIGHHKANHVCLITAEWEKRRQRGGCQSGRRTGLSDTGIFVWSGNWMFGRAGWWSTCMEHVCAQIISSSTSEIFAHKRKIKTSCVRAECEQIVSYYMHYQLHSDTQLNKHFRLQKYGHRDQGVKRFLWYQMEQEHHRLLYL